MHSLTNIEYQRPHDDANQVGVWARFQLWKASRIEARLERRSRYIARTLELDEVQRKQIVLLLRQFRKMRELIREERRNGAANLYEAVGSECFDALRVSRGIDSSVDRIHLHMDDTLQSFTGLYSTLNDNQKKILSRYLRRRVRYL